MNGKEFEQHCLYRLDWEQAQGRCCAGRYGVQGTLIDGKWAPVSSLPDIEGVLPSGRQFIFDAKVCSQASFDMAKFRPGTRESKARQLDHLMRRSKFGAITFFLIHFPERQLVKRHDPAATWAFPVMQQHQFWDRFYANETTTITRADCNEHAAAVEWNAPGSCRTERPDILSAVNELAHYFDHRRLQTA